MLAGLEPVITNQAIIDRFMDGFGDCTVEQDTPEQILTFLNRLAYL